MNYDGFEGLSNFIEEVSTTSPCNSVLRGKGTLESEGAGYKLELGLSSWFAAQNTHNTYITLHTLKLRPTSGITEKSQ